MARQLRGIDLIHPASIGLRRYYEALLLTVAELQHHMGDEEIVH